MSAVCRLDRLDLDDSKTRPRLKQQRILCGWAYDDETLDKWFSLIGEGSMNMYWIFDASHDSPAKPIGHVSLNTLDYSGDRSLASPEDHRVTFASFFIYRENRGSGMGKAVVREVERRAKEDMGAKEITINTMSDKHARNTELYAQHGDKPHHDFSMEAFYRKLGYVAFKYEPRYRHTFSDGETMILEAVFMAKQL